MERALSTFTREPRDAATVRLRGRPPLGAGRPTRVGEPQFGRFAAKQRCSGQKARTGPGCACCPKHQHGTAPQRSSAARYMLASGGGGVRGGTPPPGGSSWPPLGRPWAATEGGAWPLWGRATATWREEGPLWGPDGSLEGGGRALRALTTAASLGGGRAPSGALTATFAGRRSHPSSAGGVTTATSLRGSPLVRARFVL